MTGRTDAAGTTSYAYDKADRLATTADPLTGATLNYAYNADSLPASVSYATGGTAGPVRSYAYDGLARLTGDTLTSPSGATIASASYGYNANGDLTSQTTGGYAGAGATTYGYDEADQLTSSVTGGTTTSYAYDAAGNLIKAGAATNSYNAQNQLTSSVAAAGTTSYSYTLGGALSSVSPPSGGVQSYTANAYGQTATAPGGISYAYDALGRLTTRTTSAATTNLSYSGQGSVLASDGTASYSYDSSGSLVGTRPNGGAAQAVLTNAHGDVTGTFNPQGSTSSLAASAAYSPYGTVSATAGAMPALGYQGQYTDPATGNVDMSARWYSPATGGFTSNDVAGGSPLPSSVDGNSYAYAAGNPLTLTDPSGYASAPSDTEAPSWIDQAISGAEDALSKAWEAVPETLEIDSTVAPEEEVAADTGPWGWAADGLVLAGIFAFVYFTQNNGSDPSSGGHGGGASGNFSTGPGPIADSVSSPGADTGTGPGTGTGTGTGPCAYDCYPTYTPPVVLPPPPPPQDKYANGAQPPVAPNWLRHGAYVTSPARDVTSPSQLPRTATRIVEQTPRARVTVNGMEENGQAGTEPAQIDQTDQTDQIDQTDQTDQTDVEAASKADQDTAESKRLAAEAAARHRALLMKILMMSYLLSSLLVTTVEDVGIVARIVSAQQYISTVLDPAQEPEEETQEPGMSGTQVPAAGADGTPPATEPASQTNRGARRAAEGKGRSGPRQWWWPR